VYVREVIMRKRKTVHITTVGLREIGRVAFAISHEGASAIVLICTPESAEHADRVSREIKSMGGQQVEIVRVDGWHYDEVLAAALRYAVRYQKKGFSVVFNPSLGTRVMTSALVMAASLLERPLLLIREEQGKPQETIRVEPYQRRRLSPQKTKILRRLRNGPKSQKELGTRSELHASTISGHVKQLKEWGLVTTRRENRRVMVKMTPLGEIVLLLSEFMRLSRRRK